MMGRFMVLLTAFITTLGIATFAGAHIINAVERQSTTTTYSMKVGNLTRSWEVIAPTAKLAKSAPIVVVLSGIAATTSDEITRDRLVPYVDADKLELVYPVSYRESWNAIGCCGAAASKNVNDVAFLEALVPKVDPGRTRPIYFVGYSNGGRMAYRLECTDPSLFNGMVAVKADPMPGCVVTKPQNVLVFAALDDPWVPYKPGEKGKETPPATVQIARLQKDLKCSSKATTVKHGDMTLYTWSCADGKTLQWALYQSGGHNFPPPNNSQPGADQLIWSFISKTALAPIPS
jgi:polyhydroxybutyrate depolymerase